MHGNSPPSRIAVSMKLVSDTIEYLQMLSDHFFISDTIDTNPSSGWTKMKLVTRSLQSRYKEIITREEMETDGVSEFDSAPTPPEQKCPKCAAADKEWLYD